MISVDAALDRLFALARPTSTELLPLRRAAGRVLAAPVTATRAQPPFDASAMDGYAVAADAPAPGQTFRVVGEAAAGHGWDGEIGPGEALRIFTGAPVPRGAKTVVIQEDVARNAETITLREAPGSGTNIRPRGGDFDEDATVSAPRRLRPADLSLLAAMNVPRVPVHRRPEVALIATGDELVEPGDAPRPDQIVASNSVGLAAMVEAEGAIARLLPIARDTRAALTQAFDLARGADLIVTIGGASVGDHDLVGDVLGDAGARDFYKVAMRPGKPLMAGRIGEAAMVGLPGNPVSSLVCGHVFLLPMLRAMQGLPALPAPRRQVPLAEPLGANGPREHYMRARLTEAGVAAFDRQDSSLLGILAAADGLIVRPPHAAAGTEGELVDIIDL
ncbi:MAG: molybdopterin molybdotransferase MoeA [Paracoccaceae bacterium]|nr:molybdopterin molybdotransferase MoeA [Paracoccaceae bacterium]